jgi:hypothetical protein
MSKNKGTLVTSPIRPLSSGMTIPTAYANELLGGYQTVASVVERDNITTDRRVFGMMVYVTGTDEFYQLKLVSSPSVSDNLNWTLANFANIPSEWINSVISATGTPPVSSSVGDRYLVTSGSGAWTGFNDLIVEWNGSVWVTTTPTDGMTVRSDSDPGPVYGYLNGAYPSGSWVRQNFVITGTATEVAYFDNAGNITSDAGFTRDFSKLVTVIGMTGPNDVGGGVGSVVQVGATTSGDFKNGVYLLHLNQPSDIVISLVGVASDFQGNGYVEMTATDITTVTSSLINISPNQIQFQSNSGSTFTLPSLDGTDGQVMMTDGMGNLTFGTPSYATPSQNYVYYDIATQSTITVPDYQEYFVFGDLTVDGTLDIGTYGKVVILNGSLLTGVSSSIINMGNIEMYDFVTVPQITGPVNYLPKYANSGLTTSSVYDIRGTFSQTNINNGFQIVNSDIVNLGFGTESIAGSYFDDGVGTYFKSGIGNGVGGLGSGDITFNSNTNLLVESIVQSDRAFMLIQNFNNNSVSSIFITQSSIELLYSNTVNSQYNQISIYDNHIRNLITTSATFSVESGLGNLFSVSDVGKIHIGTISSTYSNNFVMLDDNNNLTSNILYVNQVKTFGIGPDVITQSSTDPNSYYINGTIIKDWSGGSWSVSADSFHNSSDVLVNGVTGLFTVQPGIYNIYIQANYTSTATFSSNAPLWIQTQLKGVTPNVDVYCIARGFSLYPQETTCPSQGANRGVHITSTSTFYVKTFSPSSQTFENSHANIIISFERIG